MFWDWNHKDDAEKCVVLEENEMGKIQELSFTANFPSFLAMLCICAKWYFLCIEEKAYIAHEYFFLHNRNAPRIRKLWIK